MADTPVTIAEAVELLRRLVDQLDDTRQPGADDVYWCDACGSPDSEPCDDDCELRAARAFLSRYDRMTPVGEGGGEGPILTEVRRLYAEFHRCAELAAGAGNEHDRVYYQAKKDAAEEIGEWLKVNEGAAPLPEVGPDLLREALRRWLAACRECNAGQCPLCAFSRRALALKSQPTPVAPSLPVDRGVTPLLVLLAEAPGDPDWMRTAKKVLRERACIGEPWVTQSETATIKATPTPSHAPLDAQGPATCVHCGTPWEMHDCEMAPPPAVLGGTAVPGRTWQQERADVVAWLQGAVDAIPVAGVTRALLATRDTLGFHAARIARGDHIGASRSTTTGGGTADDQG